MNERDESLRGKLIERLAAVNVDARDLAVEVDGGKVLVRGAVPSEGQRQRATEALAGAHAIDIAVRPVAPTDSLDGRGRSPLTGTSAESAHQSRHQTDPE
ncbi:MAG: BON domain-containing protein [Alphaproteobacteria bacterium]|nr:BON domain-containing protein [Alphaproteobacteria bacterium]MBV8407562.1 BON domain-containing protein [Alphaproteobacteria bacterium]